MIRKIDAEALRLGMYIHDLGCSWVDHPFLLNRFLLRAESEIRRILDAGITEVSIDTERGADVVAPAHAAPLPALGGEPDAGRRLRPAERTRESPASERAGQPRTGQTPSLSPGAVTASAAKALGAVPSSRGLAAASRMPGARAAFQTRDPPAAAAAARVMVEPETPAPDAGSAAQPDAPAPSPLPAGIRIANEFQEAQRVHSESCRVVREILTDVRLGRQVSIERTHAVVNRMAASILGNPGPLLALSRIKQTDEYTFLHCVSVSALLMVFARAAGMEEAAIREAGVGGLLHDIGKMKIPPGLLNKPGPLTERERLAMHEHVVAGVELLQATPGVTEVSLQIAAEHHERYDGTGYPKGRKGAAISRMGQMATIVDVYDAITSERAYHRGLTPAEALKRLLKGSGTQFDPALMELFIKTLGIYPTGSLVMLESGRLAVVVEQSDAALLQPRVRVVYDTRKACFVSPFDVDLARTLGHGGEDRIVRHESPQKWSVDPVAYLLEEVD